MLRCSTLLSSSLSVLPAQSITWYQLLNGLLDLHKTTNKNLQKKSPSQGNFRVTLLIEIYTGTHFLRFASDLDNIHTRDV